MKKPWAYLNENDPKAAAWLRELIRADVIVRGDVDERDIREVRPSDLVGFTQCHFFAGIGGWSYALRLAGWPDTDPVWSGSCPCQPFSVAGNGGGTADERHLWPAFYQLIAHSRPAVVFGEQVASPAGLQWLAAVQADLETSDYAVGVADLPAACVGAPHIRQRLFWVAHSNGGQPRQRLFIRSGESRVYLPEVERSGKVGIGLGDAGSPGLSQRVGDGCVQREALEPLPRQAALSASDLVDLGLPSSCGCERLGIEPTHRESVQTGASIVDLADADGLAGAQRGAQSRGRNTRGDEEPGPGPGGGKLSCKLGYTDCAGLQARNPPACAREAGSQCVNESGSLSELGDTAQHGGRPFNRMPGQSVGWEISAGRSSFWGDCDWIPCRDGKSRPVEPGTFPLAHGISGRVGLLRGYGNAIVPQVAAQFIGAYIDTFGE